MKLNVIRKPDPFDLALLGLAVTFGVAIITFGVAIIYYFQLQSMQKSVDLARRSMQLEQRAWLYANVPNVFPLNGPDIPATLPVSNIGKTVATNIIGHVIGTTFNKGEHPALDQYGLGHAHTNIYMGALYPGTPGWPIPLKIVKYGDKAGEQPTTAVPDPDLTRRIQQRETFIILFGELRYCDIFGVPHWVKFCNGSGDALGFEGIKECIYYNRADNETEPAPSCLAAIPPK